MNNRKDIEDVKKQLFQVNKRLNEIQSTQQKIVTKGFRLTPSQKAGVFVFSIITKPFMEKNKAEKLTQTPKQFFVDSKNGFSILTGNLLGLTEKSDNKKYGQINFAQKSGVYLFRLIAKPSMTKSYYEKLKSDPIAYFTDAKNPTAIKVGTLLNLRQLKQTSKQPILHSHEAKEPRDLKVAVICDEFTFNSFKYEFNPIVIEPGNWEAIFEKDKPDLFFCESAWSGTDSKNRPWQGKVYKNGTIPKENRWELINILKYCKENDIPTIFWNKEDPTHFDDIVHDFTSTASMFDNVFTSDEDCVPRYKEEYQCKNVFCLPFATQPKLFNPIEDLNRSNRVVFAGSWYKQHVKRSQDMTQIFDSILDSGKEIEIYDRCYHLEDENHQYPLKYRSFTKPAVEHDEINKVYKSSIYGLNINTVQNSNSMFARRVYELMSCRTFVISNYSKGVETLLRNNVIFADKDPDRLFQLNEEETDRIRDENLHHALDKHTYANRFKFILDSIQYRYKKPDTTITIVSIINDKVAIKEAIDAYRLITLENKKLLIVLSEDIDPLKIADLYTQYNSAGISVVSLGYLKKYATKWDQVINTPYFALVDLNVKATNNDFIRKAYLHTSYVDCMISMRSENQKYTFSSTSIIKDMLAPKDQFETLIMNSGRIIEGDFYHV